MQEKILPGSIWVDFGSIFLVVSTFGWTKIKLLGK